MDNASTGSPSRHTETRHATPGNTCTHYLNYGLTCDAYEELRARAGGCCEICNKPEEEVRQGRLIIEHYHWRNVWFVRGLVCEKCNALMARHDRAMTWGPTTRPMAAKAAEFHRNSWGATPELLEQAARDIAQRKPFTRRIGGYRPELDDLEPPAPPP